MTAVRDIGAQGDPRKWDLPGWKIEWKFNDKILIGNWFEERLQFDKKRIDSISASRTDYRSYPHYKADVIIQKNALLTNKGLSRELMFGHHGNAYSNNLITWYDQDYNKRERPEAQALPERRFWNAKSLTWCPEKSDHSLQGGATNWGLKPLVRARQAQEEKQSLHNDYISTYRDSFVSNPIDGDQLRYAVRRDKSTSLHKSNGINRDLNLRSTGSVAKDMPQTMNLPQ